MRSAMRGVILRPTDVANWHGDWMNQTMAKTIYTIGHSTHTAEKLVAMLKSFGIELLADIRTFPASRRYPHFNKDNLAETLNEANISYEHFPGLGGRRKPRPDSPNNVWRVEGFRGYADYMETEDFRNSAKDLEALAAKKTTAYMCSEAKWWSCHRSMVSDYLKSRGWTVQHIMGENKAEEHPYTKPARLVDGNLTYHSDDLFSD